MRWMLGVVGAVVGVVVLVLVVGALLPRDHLASASARFRAPPDSLWAALTDVARYTSWRADLTSAEPLPDRDGRRTWREVGKSDTITYEVVEAAPPRHLVVRIADEGLPYGGTWTYELAPEGGGTHVTVTERGQIYNPLFRFMARFLFGYTSAMDGVLRALGRKHGEAVVPEHPQAE